MDLSSLLICSVCSDQFKAPTTLHCGHSICAVHLSCPCSSSLPPSTPLPSPPKIDVTLNKLLHLCARARSWFGPPSVPDESDDHADLPPPRPAVRARSSSTESASARRRKRRRRIPSSPPPKSDTAPDDPLP